MTKTKKVGAKTNYTKNKNLAKRKVTKAPHRKRASTLAKDIKNASNVIVTDKSIFTTQIVTKRHAKTKNNIATLKNLGVN